MWLLTLKHRGGELSGENRYADVSVCLLSLLDFVDSERNGC